MDVAVLVDENGPFDDLLDEEHVGEAVGLVVHKRGFDINTKFQFTNIKIFIVRKYHNPLSMFWLLMNCSKSHLAICKNKAVQP